MELQPLIHADRFEADCPQDGVHPFVACELAAFFDETVEVETGKLDRPEVVDEEGVVVILHVVVAKRHLRPYPPFEKALVVSIEPFVDRNPLGVEVLHLTPMALLSFHIGDLHLVDELVRALLLNHGLRLVRLVGSHVILLQSLEDGCLPRIDLLLVIGGAKTRQEELQHEGRYVRPLLDLV